ncbi:NTP transferase domain-containing protein [Tersicoccus sp. MR15.9]|uniref:molybdenum cofactor guanylyltransferase n=1 Tax=Tersicoccus mangrovi TaxID=3121635 RepID=UPI002FE5F5BB
MTTPPAGDGSAGGGARDGGDTGGGLRDGGRQDSAALTHAGTGDGGRHHSGDRSDSGAHTDIGPVGGRNLGALPVDAIVLAGGRGSRLGGVDKAALTLDGRRLLDRTLDAVRGAVLGGETATRTGTGTIVVVGPDAVLPAGTHHDVLFLDRHVRLVREDPPFGGPAAATAAGLAALGPTDLDAGGSEAAAWVLLLSCDLVHPADAVAALLPAVRSAMRSADGTVDAVVGVDPDGRRQPLTAAYRRGRLEASVAALTVARGHLTGASMRELTGGLHAAEVPLTSAASADVDTVEDAHRTGVRLPYSPDQRAEEDA